MYVCYMPENTVFCFCLFFFFQKMYRTILHVKDYLSHFHESWNFWWALGASLQCMSRASRPEPDLGTVWSWKSPCLPSCFVAVFPWQPVAIKRLFLNISLVFFSCFRFSLLVIHYCKNYSVMMSYLFTLNSSGFVFILLLLAVLVLTAHITREDIRLNDESL